MAAFLAAAFFLLVTPGPGVLTVAGNGAGYGFRAGVAYAVGVVLGSLIVMGMVASGLAALILSVPYVRETLLAGSLGYLLYLAFRIATSGGRVALMESDRPLGFFNGAALSLINPKAYAVFTTLTGGFKFMPDAPAIEFLIKLALFSSLSFPIHLLWLWIGASLKKLALSPDQQRAINVCMAISMLAVVGLAVFYEYR